MADGFPAVASRRPSLPVVGQAITERADAARNRQKILSAANRMLAAEGAEALSLDEVARVAGVGIGTVYRRFGDRAGLVGALVDERERQFQAAFMTGPPPVGPGAPPAERLRAFLHALVDRIEEQRELLLLGETPSPSSRFQTGPYQMRHIHLVTLLQELIPGAEIHYLADVLLAPLAPSFLNYQREVRGLPVQRIKDGLDQLLSWARSARSVSGQRGGLPDVLSPPWTAEDCDEPSPAGGRTSSTGRRGSATRHDASVRDPGGAGRDGGQDRIEDGPAGCPPTATG